MIHKTLSYLEISNRSPPGIVAPINSAVKAPVYLALIIKNKYTSKPNRNASHCQKNTFYRTIFLNLIYCGETYMHARVLYVTEKKKKQHCTGLNSRVSASTTVCTFSLYFTRHRLNDV